jgi:hypothetical protein
MPELGHVGTLKRPVKALSKAAFPNPSRQPAGRNRPALMGTRGLQDLPH